MIVTVYGRSQGRDVSRLVLEVSGEHATALNEIAKHVAASSPESLDKVVFIWTLPQMQELPLNVEVADANHDAG